MLIFTHTHTYISVYIYMIYVRTVCDIASYHFQNINLGRLKLKEIQPRAFCGLEDLSNLYLRDNELREPPELLPVKATLEVLVLSNNKISIIPSFYFSGFKKLRSLEIDENFLSNLPNIGVVGSSLMSLSASKNRIESLDPLLKQRDLLVLQMFNGSRNNMKALDVKIFNKVPNVTHFDLTNNKLRHLDDFRPYLVNWNSTLRLPVSIGFNPWNCGPDLAWMLELEGIKGIPEAHMFCHSPKCRNGRNIFVLSLYDYTYGRQGVSIYWSLECLFNSALRLPIYKFQSSELQALCVLVCGGGGDSPVTSGSGSQRASNHDDIIKWKH